MKVIEKPLSTGAFSQAYPANFLDSKWLMGLVNMTTILLHIQIRFPTFMVETCTWLRCPLLTSIGHSHIAKGPYAKMHESTQCNGPEQFQSVIYVDRLKYIPVDWMCSDGGAWICWVFQVYIELRIGPRSHASQSSGTWFSPPLYYAPCLCDPLVSFRLIHYTNWKVQELALKVSGLPLKLGLVPRGKKKKN